MRVVLYINDSESGEFNLPEDEDPEWLITQALRMYLHSTTWTGQYDYVREGENQIEAKINRDAKITLTGVKRCGPW